MLVDSLCHPRACSDRRGAVLLFVALFLGVLLAMMGWALDTSFVWRSHQQLQASADAAALAAADLVLEYDVATQGLACRQAAVDIAALNPTAGTALTLDLNLANGESGDIVVGRWVRTSRTFFPGINRPNAVMVTARRTTGSTNGQVPLNFGPAYGVNGSDMTAVAIARRSYENERPHVLVLHPSLGKAMDLRGTAKLLVNDGGVHVNSSHASQAIYLNGAPEIARLRALSVTAVGGASYPSGAVSPIPQTGSYMPDPLDAVPYPSTAGMTNYGSITGAGTYSPGYYPGGIDFNSGVAQLTPGVYVIGTGCDLTGDARISGTEVVLCFEPGAAMRTSGSAPGFVISPPTSGDYEGICVFAHRSNTEDFSISGGGLFDVDGMMYLPAAHLEMDGNVNREVGAMLVNTLLLRGTADYLITGTGPPQEDTLRNYLVR